MFFTALFIKTKILERIQMPLNRKLIINSDEIKNDEVDM